MLTLSDLKPGLKLVYFLRSDPQVYWAELVNVLGVGLEVQRNGQNETVRWENLELWLTPEECQQTGEA